MTRSLKAVRNVDGSYARNGKRAKAGLNRAILDVAPAEFRRQITYKLAWHGGTLVIADRYFPSSKRCSSCGAVKAKLSLAERTYRWAGSSDPRNFSASWPILVTLIEEEPVTKRMSRELEWEVVRLTKQGRTMREIAALMGRSKTGIAGVLDRAANQRLLPKEWNPSPARLSMTEREEIRAGIERGESFTTIANLINRAVSTVSREVSGNAGRDKYRATTAHKEAGRKARRPKSSKLICGPLLDKVTEWLEEWWSPEEISRRLRMEFPDDPMMWVSHETIYQSLYVQGRGELRRELSRCLRSGRANRRARYRLERRGRISEMVMISDRPAEARDRAVPGHWEDDLILGRNNDSAVGTLVERSTRFVLLLHLPDDHGAMKVNKAMQEAIARLPAELFRSITWDQGGEMARHQQFTIDTGIDIYFCNPHSPWQRGSNENTNGLLRQYMPKGTDLSLHTKEDLDRFARSLNNRPRETLGFMKPSEKLAELLALTG